MPRGLKTRPGYRWVLRAGEWIEVRNLTAAEKAESTRKRLKTRKRLARERAAQAGVDGPRPKTRRAPHGRRKQHAHARAPDIDEPATNGADEPVIDRVRDALAACVTACNWLYEQFPGSRELQQHCREDVAHDKVLLIERILRRVSAR
jgi:hypothetical protein